ncbi:Sarcalumenin [Trachymyrmex septentrionalis]|uniref:Sarcalumenin n=1 Tax=Trachymyrmex septentrionalis TaxID=34720 RepID=A0A195FVR7_9HYME|nr:PREDICTED: sarcalumenin isoform X3 [Trachymyrmex septentrionalis]KYN44553.1 Sarcalumenin [Trachymyrmex septentrionalis]
MTGTRMRPALVVGLLLSFLAVALRGVQCEDEQVPSEDLCRPYIEKALKDLGTGSLEQTSAEVGTEIDQENDLADDEEASPTSEEAGEAADDVSKEETEDKEGSVEESAEAAADESKEATEEQTDAREEKEQEIEEEQSEEDATDKSVEEEEAEKAEEASTEATEDEEEQTDSSEKVIESEEARTEEDEKLDEEKSDEETKVKDEKFEEEEVDDEAKSEEEKEEVDESQAEDEEQKESKEATEEVEVESNEEVETQQTSAEVSEEVEQESDKEEVDGKTDEAESIEDQTVSDEDEKSDIDEKTQDESAEAESEEKDEESAEDAKTASSESVEEETKSEEAEAKFAEEEKEEEDTTASSESVEEETKSEEEETKSEEDETKSEEAETKSTEEEDTKTEEEDGKSEEEDAESKGEGNQDVKLRNKREIGEEGAEADGESSEEVASDEEQEPTPEEDLIQEIEIPENLRPREHINQLLKLDEENEAKERAIQREADIILRDLKRLYDNAIKPLETMYKYRDLSNRHFGDPEIFSKPLVLFMGPWSGGKSSIINYLLDIEYKPMSLRTGAEPSPAYFNIIMHGEEEEVLDGTQLAADWTFSGLQKFGQGLLDRLRGLRLNNNLLEKVNIVEIPGILEIRKQVQRLFPFNDACQWFIDRADIIFLVYDPAKLDVGPETEAILDQLKGREYQTRIILNKADQVKPEELMRVQGALIWNISPLMSSAEPPIMYSTSLWSLPYEAGAPIRLLYAQERAFLRDLRSAINKRVEHKIASARRFAVRVRNHAKMVDCYLTTYYNHKTFFGNKREISDKIIENPQDYHIYEGLSTLTNISRYDLPDPDVYRDFFRLNPLYDFPLLSSTCTYFRGCPINRLDVSIAYDLPELVGNYKKSVEAVLHESEGNSPPS